MGAKLSTGGGKKRGKYGANADMNVIPFIDILLVLLIIFMVAAPIPTVDVKVDLPPPVPPIAEDDPKKPTLVDIVMAADGSAQVFVDSALTEVPDLFNTTYGRVAINVPGSPNPLLEEVKVRAEQRLPYVEVMRVMATLQEGGFNAVSLVAETAIDPSTY
jgi:biopolymer transport protein ExbD